MNLVKTDEFLSLFFVLRLGSEDKPSWPGGLCQKCRLGIFEFEMLWNGFEIVLKLATKRNTPLFLLKHHAPCY
jgi:hypothetical protein